MVDICSKQHMAVTPYTDHPGIRIQKHHAKGLAQTLTLSCCMCAMLQEHGLEGVDAATAAGMAEMSDKFKAGGAEVYVTLNLPE
jgi:hypothetical protein